MDDLEYWFYFLVGFSIILNNVLIIPKLNIPFERFALSIVTIGIAVILSLFPFKKMGMLEKKRVKIKKEDG